MAGNENISPEILVATIDDAKLIYIFDKIKKIFGENVSVEYLSGPNIKINELNEKKFYGEYIIQKATLSVEEPFKFKTENRSLKVFEVHFQRNPLNFATQASPWVNSFFTKTYYLSGSVNNTQEAINANKNWLCENEEKIINSIVIITKNTIITPSNLPPDNSQIATLISGMRDAHQRIMADYQQQLKDSAISNEKREKIFNEKEQKREKFYNEKLKELELER